MVPPSKTRHAPPTSERRYSLERFPFSRGDLRFVTVSRTSAIFLLSTIMAPDANESQSNPPMVSDPVQTVFRDAKHYHPTGDCIIRVQNTLFKVNFTRHSSSADSGIRAQPYTRSTNFILSTILRYSPACLTSHLAINKKKESLMIPPSCWRGNRSSDFAPFSSTCMLGAFITKSSAMYSR